MTPHQTGLIIFITIVVSFFYTWKTKNFVTAIVICSAIATFGVLILPDSTIAKFHVLIAGELYLWELTMNNIKVALILGLLINLLVYKYKGSGLLKKFGIDLKQGAEI